MSALDSSTPLEQRADLREYLRVLWRRRWIFLIVAILVPAGAFLVTSRLEKVYQSSVLLQVQAANVDTSLIDGGSSGFLAPEALAAAARLVETSGVAEQAARQLGEGRESVGELRSSIDARADEETSFINITASSSTPERAREVADAFAEAVVVTRSRDARRRVDRTVQQVTEDLKTLKPNDIDGRRQLSQQLQRLRTLRAAQDQNARVVEAATLPADPVSPHPQRNGVLGLLLGVFLGIGAVIVAEHLDRRIRRPEELERLTGAPLLATVPVAAFPGGEPLSQVGLAFQGLRDTLTFFNVSEPVDSIAVTSPLKGDGKTTVATNLAIALARSGKSVIIVDADLRHPQVATRLGVETSTGVSSLLAMDAPPEEALVEAPMFGRRLRVLASGPIPPNPSELIGSPRMRRLLSELKSLADLVIIDTTPLLAVSDALPLLDQVSGTIVVAKLDSTSSDAISRLMQVASTGNAHVLGVVATGAKAGGLYAYGAYGYSYGVTPEGEASEVIASGASGVNGNSTGSRLRKFVSRS